MAITPSAANTVATLNGLFKEVYAENISNVKPKGLHLLRDVSFVSRQQMPGNEFHQPVSLSHEGGFTYASANSGAFTLGAASAHMMRDAKIVGTQCLLRTQIDYETAARSSSGGPRAFKQGVGVVVENMNDSHSKRCEIDMFYGQAGIGTVQTGGITGQVITISTATFAPGIWAGQEGSRIKAYASTGATADQHSVNLTITAIDIDTRKITVTGTLAADASAAKDSVLYFDSQRDTDGGHQVFAGLDTLLSTTTGTVLNISTDDYSLWQASQHAVGGDLTFAAVNKAVAKAVSKGLTEDLVLYLNPNVWTDLLDDEAALRRHNSPGKYDVGAEGITFFSQNGTIMIKPSIYCKLSRGYLISPALWKRVGATDITFNLPDRGDEFFRHMENAAGYELRSYSNQALFTKALSKGVVLTGITHTF